MRSMRWQRREALRGGEGEDAHCSEAGISTPGM